MIASLNDETGGGENEILSNDNAALALRFLLCDGVSAQNNNGQSALVRTHRE